MLDEPSKRWAAFTPGLAVKLADGQAWTLPRPVVIFRPAENEAGFETRAKIGDDGKFTKAFDAYDKAESGAETIKAELAMASALLLSNYDLTPSEVADLLEFSYTPHDTSDAARIRKEVMDVALGRGNGLADDGEE